MLRIELKNGEIRLSPNETMRVRDGAGRTVCAVEGAVWITEENDPRDIVLEAGECYRLKHDGVAILNSLSGEAAVHVQ